MVLLTLGLYLSSQLNFLKISSQTPLEVCFQGDYKSSQIDKEDQLSQCLS